MFFYQEALFWRIPEGAGLKNCEKVVLGHACKPVKGEKHSAISAEKDVALIAFENL